VIVPQIEFYSCACTVRLQTRKFDEVDCVQKIISEKWPLQTIQECKWYMKWYSMWINNMHTMQR